MRVLMAQVSPVVGDVAGNAAICRAAGERARAAGCRVCVLPELVVSGYPPRDLLERADFVAACQRAAHDVAASSDGDLILVFGAPWRPAEGARLRNAAVVAHGGHIVDLRFKALLPTYDVFDERRYFEPETDPRPLTVGGLRLGVTICEDIWTGPGGRPWPAGGGAASRAYDVDPIARMGGCDLVVNLSASPFHAGKGRLRYELLRRQATRAGVPIAYCNAVGGNDELVFDGDSLALSPAGSLLAQGPAFAESDVVVDLDGEPSTFRSLPFEEEVLSALRLGVHDYARRCGFSSAVLGLSGGIDSALVAAIAARALGPDRVLAVGMPGPFSSEGSVTDSRALADRLGIRFEVAPIGRVNDAFLDALAPFFRDRPRDVAEENLQARARGTLLMGISNKLGHLLLTTGNKSEMAVGYCTLYGDMNGGLGVIADVFKTDVYRLCRWMNRDGDVVPKPILDKPPSAELAWGQTDQDSLPPYEVLDDVLRLYVEGMVDPEEIIAQGHDAETVRRIVRMVVLAEYKRWQAAPALRVSPKAFGTGRRLPLAQRWHLRGSPG